MSPTLNPILSTSNDHSNSKLYIFSAVFTLIGIAIFFLGNFIIKTPTSSDLIKTATITQLIQENDTYTPTFTYTINGQTYTKTHYISSTHPTYAEPETSNIFYNPNFPEDATLIDPNSELFIKTITSILGFIFASLGISTVIIKQLIQNNLITERIMGAITAHFFSIPSTLALPIMIYLHQNPPNFLNPNSGKRFFHRTNLHNRRFNHNNSNHFSLKTSPKQTNKTTRQSFLKNPFFNFTHPNYTGLSNKQHNSFNHVLSSH